MQHEVYQLHTLIIACLVSFIIGFFAFPILLIISANQDYKETNEHNRKRQNLQQ